jgi:hypothetical protein
VESTTRIGRWHFQRNLVLIVVAWLIPNNWVVKAKMVSSLVEAMSLLNKWRAERSMVHCVFSAHSSCFDFVGTVHEIVGSRIQISHEGVDFVADLIAAKSFKYCEPPDSLLAPCPSADDKYSAALEIGFKGGEGLVLYEFRTE